MDGTVATRRDARAELQTWYLTSLAPKLADAAAADVVPTAAARALDRQLREFLDLPSAASRTGESRRAVGRSGSSRGHARGRHNEFERSPR